MNGKDVATENDHPRATTASIDRRVERLEGAQAATDRKVDDLRTEVTFMNKIFELKFEAVESAVNANTTKLDAFVNKIETMITEALKQSGDIRAQPLGRQVDDRLRALEHKADEHDKAIIATQGVGVAFRQYVIPLASLGVAAASLLAWLHGSLN